MSYENLADSEQKSMRHLARAVLDQLTAGRSPEDVIRELQGNGWPLEEAREFVGKLDEQRESFSRQLEIRFPEMKPVRRQPALFTVNGIGTGMYGARGKDAETGTYVKTWCVCFVFVPILALAAYRVAAAQHGGWYLIGKVRLSRLARLWNWSLLLGILAVVGLVYWNSHTSSPEYVAREKMERADTMLNAGDIVGASRLYAELVQGGTQQSAAARRTLAAVCESPALANLPGTDITYVFELCGTAGGWGDDAVRVFRAGAGWARKFASEDPATAMQLLRAIWRLSVPESEQLLAEFLTGPFQELPASAARDTWSAALALDQSPDQRQAVVTRGLDWIAKHSAADPRGALAGRCPVRDRGPTARSARVDAAPAAGTGRCRAWGRRGSGRAAGAAAGNGGSGQSHQGAAHAPPRTAWKWGGSETARAHPGRRGTVRRCLRAAERVSGTAAGVAARGAGRF